MDKFQVDELKLYMSEDVKIANGIVLKCPKLKDVVEYGESEYFSMVIKIIRKKSFGIIHDNPNTLNF